MIKELMDKENKSFKNSNIVGEYAELTSGDMHYFKIGSGEPLLLIHGIGQSMYGWHDVMYELAESFEVIAIDLFGSGYSGCPVGFGHTITDHANSIIEFLGYLGLKKVHVCAFSTGAIIALKLSQIQPKLIDKQVLLAPGGITRTLPQAVKGLDSAIVGWLYAMLFGHKMVKSIIETAFFDRTFVTEEIIEQYYLPFVHKPTLNSVLAMLRAFEDAEVLSHLREVESRVLIIWGIDDKWHQLESAEQYKLGLPKVEFSIIRNCGHMICEEKPKKFCESAIEFLLSEE